MFLQKEDRSDGPLFITVPTYPCVQVRRTQLKKLKKAGINDSWATLRKTLSVQRRVTTSLRRKGGRTLHVRKSTVAEPALMAIYQVLAINPAPGGTKKTDRLIMKLREKVLVKTRVRANCMIYI